MADTTPCVFVGIDVSGDHLDLARHDRSDVQRFPNTEEGIAQILALVRSWPVSRIAIESTGKLERPLLSTLLAGSQPACLVNPDRVRKFAQALGLLAKTDNLDAHVLARFAQHTGPRISTLSSEKQQELADLLTCRRQLIDTRTAHSNQLRRTNSTFAKQRLESVLKLLKAEIKSLDQRIAEIIESDDDMRRTEAIIRSVSGAGAVLAAMLISQLRELGQLGHRQLNALVGIAPYNDDSGRHRGKHAIRGGRKEVRDVIYVATVAAVRCNPDIKAAYQNHRARGLPPKSAILACSRKFLRTLNAMVRDGTTWTPKITQTA